jgi:MFS family permease
MAISTFSARDHRRNRVGFVLDYVFFNIGLTFAGINTILPAFAARLTADPVLIGLVGAVWMGGWLLPQIFAARYLSTAPRKMPFILFFSWIGRPVFLLFALYLFLSGAVWPGATLFLLYLASFYFSFTDSITGVAWFDLLGKALSPRERGRFIGLGQAAAGILSIAAGVAIRWVLESSGLGFPNDYAVILALADVCFMLSLFAIYLVREPVERVAAERQRMAEYLPGLIQLIRRDRMFLRVNVARLLIGLIGLASPFFVVYAIRVQGLPEGDVGWFAIAQTIGLAVAGLALGGLAERRGSVSVVRIVGGIYLAAPVLVMASGALGAHRPLATVLMAAAFLMLGMGDGSIMLGFLNYVLDIAPPDQRPVYVGLTNTLAGVTILYPFLGGALVDLGGYWVVFLLAAVGVVAGWAVGASLPAVGAFFPGGGRPPEGVSGL